MENVEVIVPKTIKKVGKKTKKTDKSVEEKNMQDAEICSTAVEQETSTVEKKKKSVKKVKDVETSSTSVKQETSAGEQETITVEKKKKAVKKVKDPNAPKRELNPIMKEMNRFRNEVISLKIGSKAPKLTIPPFKKCMEAARSDMNLNEKDKNTVEVVQKAISLFEANSELYL